MPWAIQRQVVGESSRRDELALALIERLVFTHLERGLPRGAANAAEEHALRLMGSERDNRRGLRRFLAAHWSGNRDYLSRHPANVAWFRQHPAVRQELWEAGVSLACEGFTITLERDPMEVLKLGTYAGSCLGVGGICAYSAAAVLLDINKQVLYARNPAGRVIARQLVAISDEERLVCFSVYPASAPKAVHAAFVEYDRRFAAALALPLHESGEYSVALVLSTFWWDDGLPVVEEAPDREN